MNELDEAMTWKEKILRDAIIEEVIEAIPDKIISYIRFDSVDKYSLNPVTKEYSLKPIKQQLRAYFKLERKQNEN